jgi:hypothetical protein
VNARLRWLDNFGAQGAAGAFAERYGSVQDVVDAKVGVGELAELGAAQGSSRSTGGFRWEGAAGNAFYKENAVVWGFQLPLPSNGTPL